MTDIQPTCLQNEILISDLTAVLSTYDRLSHTCTNPASRKNTDMTALIARHATENCVLGASVTPSSPEGTGLYWTGVVIVTQPFSQWWQLLASCGHVPHPRTCQEVCLHCVSGHERSPLGNFWIKTGTSSRMKYFWFSSLLNKNFIRLLQKKDFAYIITLSCVDSILTKQPLSEITHTTSPKEELERKPTGMHLPIPGSWVRIQPAVGWSQELVLCFLVSQILSQIWDFQSF